MSAAERQTAPARGNDLARRRNRRSVDLRAVQPRPRSETECDCHDPLVFGHQPPCFAAVRPAWRDLLVAETKWIVADLPEPEPLAAFRPWRWSLTMEVRPYSWSDFARYLLQHPR